VLGIARKWRDGCDTRLAEIGAQAYDGEVNLYRLKTGARHVARINPSNVGEYKKGSKMSRVIHWTCPFCDRDTTLRYGDYSEDSTFLKVDNAEGHRSLKSLFIVCPNPQCRKITLTMSIHEARFSQNQWRTERILQTWNLIPPSKAKTFPSFVPQVVIDDYNEACLICDLSPKASATLSRRCLQGILRDFWKVKPGRLFDEIDAVKDKIDPITWEAIDAVRKIGNIGAHMEKDINVIVDVDPNEAELLIGLIETLIHDWYIAREDRKKRLTMIRQVADSKNQTKQQKAPQL